MASKLDISGWVSLMLMAARSGFMGLYGYTSYNIFDTTSSFGQTPKVKSILLIGA